ncbi:MAG TPA: hypothetical protein VG796_25340 [Verrucomicrobiales bacterium]|nr:hypothetical protein [Verrucomicrobiales bacterium]
MKIIVPFCFILMTICGACLAADSLPADPNDLFDFPDSEATKEEKKKAQETVAKDGLLAEVSLPEPVRAMLDRLTVFEEIENTIVVRHVTPLRTAAKDGLLALADKSEGAAKLDCVALAKYVEGCPIEKILDPGSVALTATGMDKGEQWNRNGKLWNELLPNGSIRKIWTTGRWQWLNKQRTILLIDYYGGNYADLVTLRASGLIEAWAVSNDTRTAGWEVKRTALPKAELRKPAPDGIRILTEAAKAEQAVRVKAAKEIAERRTAVSAWLVTQAKTAAPDVAKKILVRAASLSAAPGTTLWDKADRLAGTWPIDEGRLFEFRPDGNVAINGQTGKATWVWAKHRNWNTALIRFGKPDDPTECWFARINTKEPGRLYVNSPTKSSVVQMRW